MRWSKPVAMALAFACAAPPAWAACTVNTTPVSFGGYDPIWGAAATAVGAVNVNCGVGEGFTVSLDRGLYAPDFTPRLMQSAAGREIQYNLYTGADLQNIWGDELDGTVRVAGTGTGATQSFFVHGRIPGSQNVSVGTYEDTVTVTVSF